MNCGTHPPLDASRLRPPSMGSLHVVPDLPKKVQEHLYFLRFEDLMDHLATCMAHVYAWLGLG